MRTLWNNISQKKKLFAIFLILCILPINVIGMISYYTSTNVLEKKIGDDFLVIASQFNTAMVDYLEDFDRFSTIPYFNPKIIEILDKTNASQNISSYQQLIDRDTIFDAMQAYPFINQSIESMVIYGLDGSIYGYHKDKYGSNINMNYRPDREEWFQTALKNKGKVVISGIRKQQQFMNQTADVITVSRTLYNKNFVPIAVVAVDVSPKYIEELVQNIEIPGIQITVVDRSNNIVFASNPARNEEISAQMKATKPGQRTSEVRFSIHDGRDALIGVRHNDEYSGWSTFFLIESSVLFKESTRIKHLTISITLVLMAVFVSIAWIFARMLSKPMEELMRWMKRLQLGNFSIPKAVERKDEIGRLYSSYGNMVMSLKEMMRSIEEKERKKREAELYAHRSRINPHFLYNTLNSIRMLAMIQKSSLIADMIQSLNELLKANMRLEKDLIPLRDELSILDHYLKVMKLRYTHQIETEIHVDESLLDTLVPPLILQPLVENSIFHGLNHSNTNIRIRIGAEPLNEGRDIALTVDDNGAGIDEGVLASVKQTLDENAGSERIGIANVNERVKLRYGPTYGLSIESRINEGTRASVTLRKTSA